jgi:hypothetical protein
MRKLLLCILALCPASAVAQTVLFDDFNGDALAPTWSHVASRWQYNVSNGMLNVTALTYPSNPQSPSNFASMGAVFPVQHDFRVDVRMGWDGGDPPEGIEFLVLDPLGRLLATFGYRNGALGLNGIIAGAGSSYATSVPSPGPGMHDFTLIRAADQFQFYLNDTPVASFPDDWEREATSILIDFNGPFPGQFGELHLDRVRVVPVPAAGVLLTMALSIIPIRVRGNS